MQILITNDDGIRSEGIHVLAREASAFGPVTVAAPEQECSASSQRITLREEIIYRSAADFGNGLAADGQIRAFAVKGTPADCVKIALHIPDIGPARPDLVLTGINNGLNTGFDIAYSATIGAAMEARMNGIKAIAVSNCLDAGFELIHQYLHGILEELIAEPAPEKAIWNVNFPDLSQASFQGILRDVTIGKMQYIEDKYAQRTLADGSRALKAVGCMHKPEDTVPGTDLWAVNHGYICIGKIPCMVL